MPNPITTPAILKETSRGFDRISLEDALFESREIFLTGPVDAGTMDQLIKQLLYLSRESAEREITLYINSPGGEVQSGLAAYDLIRLIKAPVRTVCVGAASSMGAILFLAGSRREMLPNARLMIHDPAPGGGSMEGLKPGDLSEKLASLKKAQKTLCTIIAEATGQSESAVRAKTKKDSFFSAQEALDFGLATGIVDTI